MSLLFPYLFILFIVFLLNHNDSSATTIESTTHSIFQMAFDKLLKEEQDLNKELEQLKIDQEKFKEEKIQSQKLVENIDVIQLNVGGQLIMTTRETLTQIPKSILAIIFNGRWQHKLPTDQEGNIFLDFNPVLFRHLLDQLQILETNNPIIFHPPFIPTLVTPFNRMLQKLGLNASLSSKDSIITLNVGGQAVTNHYKTLTRLSKSNSTTGDSCFNITKFDNNSNVFLDHDPKLFQHLISHLREGSPKHIDSLVCHPNKERNAFKRKLLDSNIDRPQVCIPNITVNARWIQNGVTVAGGNGSGNGLNQLYHPEGLYVDDDQTIYVADFKNHRIVEWKSGATTGQVVAGGNGYGNQTNQLNGPTAVIVDKKTDSLIICDYGNKRVVRWSRRNGTSGKIIISDIDCWDLAMDHDGYLYVSDYNKHEVKRWKMGETNGTVVAGGNGKGNRLDQLNRPTYIIVDQNHSVYVSDNSNQRIIKWMKGAKEGIVVAGGQGNGNGLTQLSNSYGIAVDQLGTVYVADFGNHRIMRWLKGATQGSVVVGGNGLGGQSNQFSGPFDLSLDRQGNLFVTDYNNHRVQKFSIDATSNM